MPTNELLTRAVSEVVPRELAEEKLKSGKPIRLYLGIDPTGAKLHLGHSVPLRKLRAFQRAGHEVIFLIGSFTAMIGDPTGRETQRDPLTREQVLHNFETYKQQAALILDFDNVEVVYNHQWLEKLMLVDIMNLASHFTVQQMMQRDMFRERMTWKVICDHCKKETPSPIGYKSSDEDIESFLAGANEIRCEHCGKMILITKENLMPPANPLTPNEFMYPLMQGYDSVMLDVDCEIGGSDQLLNMLAGRKLQKAFGKREKFVLTTKLIEGTDGRKMSKTYDNCIYLEDPANDMYGKILSINDELIVTYMECCTDIPMEEVTKAEKDLKKSSVNPKDLKMRLAREIVTLYHGAEAAKDAEQEFQTVHKDKGIPDEVPELPPVKKGIRLIDALVNNGAVKSTSEFRRLVTQKAIHMNGKLVDSIEEPAQEGVIKIGKRAFFKIIFA